MIALRTLNTLATVETEAALAICPCHKDKEEYCFRERIHINIDYWFSKLALNKLVVGLNRGYF